VLKGLTLEGLTLKEVTLKGVTLKGVTLKEVTRYSALAGAGAYLAVVPIVAVVVQNSLKHVTRYTALAAAGPGNYLAALLFCGLNQPEYFLAA